MHGLQQVLDDLVDSGAVGVLMQYRGPDGEWRGSAGVAELDSDRRVEPDGWFRIGSVTKTLTASVVLSMVHDGMLTLDDSCEQWLPGLIPRGGEVTVRQLLDHTSGLHNYTDEFPDAEQIVLDRYRHWGPSQLIEIATAHAPSFGPGTSWEYSNTNYIVLGLLIEAVAGHRYAAELGFRVLGPLALRRIVAPDDEVALPDPHAHGYIAADGELVDISNLNASQAWAAGALVATADDLNKFYASLLTGVLLGSDELEQMLTLTNDGDYGLGIHRVSLPSGHTVWGHFGGIFGYLTGSYHSRDASRQVTFSCTIGATEPDLSNVLAQIFTDDHWV